MLKTQKFKYLKAFLLMTLLTMVLGCANVFAAGGTGVKEPILSQIEPKGVTSVYSGQQLKLRARRYEIRVVLALSAARKARGGAAVPNVRGRRMGNRRQQRDTEYRCEEHDQGFLLHGRTFLMNDERGHV